MHDEYRRKQFDEFSQFLSGIEEVPYVQLTGPEVELVEVDIENEEVKIYDIRKS